MPCASVLFKSFCILKAKANQKECVMPFFEHKDQKAETVWGGLERRILARGGKLMAMEARLPAGFQAPAHAHPHEQVSYVVEGQVRARIGDAWQTISAGDSFYVPPDTEHEVVAVDKSTLVDVFTPQREEYLQE